MPNINDHDLRMDLMRYFNFVQPNVVEFREFEYNQLLSSIKNINTTRAIDMDSTTQDDLQLDYQMVRAVLLEPRNFKDLYTYRDTQQFLAQKAEQYITVNKDLIDRLKTYLND